MPEQIVMLALLIAMTPIDIGRRVDVGQPFAVAQDKADTLQGAARPATDEEVKSFIASIEEGSLRYVQTLPKDLEHFALQELDAAEAAAQARERAEQADAEAKAKAVQEAAAAEAKAQEAAAAKAAEGAQAPQGAADAQAVDGAANQEAAAKTPAKAGKKA